MPNIAIPAPPRTGYGIDATTAPAFGNNPNNIRIPPEAATTKRLFTPVKFTSPTFWPKAVWGKVLNIPASIVANPSVLRPLVKFLSSISFPTISCIAIIFPVASVIITNITNIIEIIAVKSNLRAPKYKGISILIQPELWTLVKSDIPNIEATIVPTTIPNSIDIFPKIPLKNLYIIKIKIKTNKANKIFLGLANEEDFTSLPAHHLTATGSNEIPIIVITVPVTTLGKNLISFPKKGAIIKQNNPAINVAPKIVVIPVIGSPG